jgi:hypothetical protein
MSIAFLKISYLPPEPFRCSFQRRKITGYAPAPLATSPLQLAYQSTGLDLAASGGGLAAAAPSRWSLGG